MCIVDFDFRAFVIARLKMPPIEVGCILEDRLNKESIFIRGKYVLAINLS
jgi:hypothetical protein